MKATADAPTRLDVIAALVAAGSRWHRCIAWTRGCVAWLPPLHEADMPWSPMDLLCTGCRAEVEEIISSGRAET